MGPVVSLAFGSSFFLSSESPPIFSNAISTLNFQDWMFWEISVGCVRRRCEAQRLAHFQSHVSGLPQGGSLRGSHQPHRSSPPLGRSRETGSKCLGWQPTGVYPSVYDASLRTTWLLEDISFMTLSSHKGRHLASAPMLLNWNLSFLVRFTSSHSVGIIMMSLEGGSSVCLWGAPHPSYL